MTEPTTKGRAAAEATPEQEAQAAAELAAAEAAAHEAAVQVALDAHKSLLEAVAWVAGQTGEVPKKGFNNHFGYSYVTKDDIVHHLKPLLLKAGLAIIPVHVKTERSEEDAKGFRDLVVTWEMRIIHAPTGASMSVPWESESMDNQDKGFAKAATSAMKQFVQAIFDIPSGDLDTEHDAHSGQVREGGARESQRGQTRGNGGAIGVRQLLDYKSQNSITNVQYDWAITQPEVGATAGMKLVDIAKDKYPTIMALMERVVAERANRDAETGEPKTAAPADGTEPEHATYDPSDPVDDIPFRADDAFDRETPRWHH